MEKHEKEKFNGCTKEMQRISLKMFLYGTEQTIYRTRRRWDGSDNGLRRGLLSREPRNAHLLLKIRDTP